MVGAIQRCPEDSTKAMMALAIRDAPRIRRFISASPTLGVGPQ